MPEIIFVKSCAQVSVFMATPGSHGPGDTGWAKQRLSVQADSGSYTGKKLKCSMSLRGGLADAAVFLEERLYPQGASIDFVEGSSQ